MVASAGASVFPRVIIDAPDEHAIRARLERFGPDLRLRLEATIGRLTSLLYQSVLSAEPIGSGRLRSETRMFVNQGENFIRGRVRIIGPAAEHARAGALEYGAHRIVHVKAHQRDGFRVEDYSRRPNIRSRRFLRGPLASIQAAARTEIAAAIAAATRAETR